MRIGSAAAYTDRLGALEEPLRRTAYGSRAGHNAVPAIQALFLLANHAWFAGQWELLRRTAGDGLELCEELRYPMPSWPGRFHLGCVAAACGDYPAARALAEEMDQWARPRRIETVRHYAAHIRTMIALAQGDFEAAYRHAEAVSPAGSLPAFTPHALWIVLDLIEAAVRTGRRAQALEHVRAVREAGLDSLSPRLHMLVLACAGLAAEDGREADAAFGAALAVAGAERWPFDLARIRLYYGERLRRGKAPARARRHLAAAAETFGRLGAAPWARRAAQESRACGAPARGTAGPGTATLTPQQWAIASLAAAGLTNKQIGERLFLSSRTVSTHLYQVFPKLGVTSRAALRDALTPLESR
ncbi:helix-turn-helix transcriptional regulator [Actinospica durhamensis]|uniref:Helix-turn-helix transcriptional regulator n=1 Tax=Actinospica durhamensis TaxID=1508375 RepID=A0A941EYC5_9ACTN|nr:helix-turn-helix transcriptional regulator [Actinospica durhamensis]MBR7838627.1 helix-turn-helix transcriptional regulator [Actinospica durhamensis]